MSSIGITVGEILTKIRKIESAELHLEILKENLYREMRKGTDIAFDRTEVTEQEEYLATLMDEEII